MYTVNLLIRTVEHHQILAYGIIFLGMIIEGDLLLISTGVLAHLGAINLWVAILFAFLGAFSKTFIGYKLGEFLYKKFNYHKFFQYMRKRVFNVLPRFKTKPYWSIFASKFIIGANNIVIIFSGYEKINYKRFLKAEFSATAIWVPLMVTIGYFFSYTALHVSRDIWRFLVVVLILFIVFVLFDKLVSSIYELSEEFYNENQ